MLNAAWIEREAPLAVCPLIACRRDGRCRHSTDRDPCRRLHETKDEARYALAAKLEAFAREAERRDPEGKNRVPEGSPEQERRLHFLKDLLHQADADECAREKAAAAAARRKG
jgi:hypothetical protein